MSPTFYDGFAVGGKPGYGRYSADPLQLEPISEQLDLTAAVGQRSATWRWDLINGVTGMRLGALQPIRDQPATIGHDSSRTIKRDLRIMLDAVDLAEINPLTDRILPFMHVAGREWQLGRYMFTGDSRLLRTGGDDGALQLMDEMNLVDQEILRAFTSTSSCDTAMRQLVEGLNLPRGTDFAATPYPAVGAWAVGARRGAITDALSVIGDLETPWMDNTGVMRAVRTVDPATVVPDLSFDLGYPVIADTPLRTNDLLTAPNRFVVVGSGSASATQEIVGVYDIPPSAPHSIANRGFAIQKSHTLQLASTSQAVAAARAVGMRSTPVEQYSVTTPPDPRHDGYQVIRWQGENWLETAWSMSCVEGGDMTHTLRRAYR